MDIKCNGNRISLVEEQTCCRVGVYWISVLSFALCSIFTKYSVCSLFDSPLCSCITSLLFHTPPHLLHVALNWTELARNHLNVDKCYRAVVHIGDAHVHMFNNPHNTDTRPHRHTQLKLQAHREIFIQITPDKNKNSPNSQRSQFGIKSVLHQMPCLPTLWQPTQLLCAQPTVFYTQLISHMLHQLPSEYLVGKYFLHQLKLIWQPYRWSSWRNV